MTIINAAVEAVAGLINNLSLFSVMKRGALGTGAGLSCEVGASGADTVFLDKNQYLIVDITINGKHPDLRTLSEDMNTIHQALTMMKSYPAGDDYKIVDITTQTEPQIIGRGENGEWEMASGLYVKIETKL